jgi:hypothetical protein
MERTWFWRGLACGALALLGACGGGGGGGPAVSTVTLNGTATFDSVPNLTGALNYSAITAKPVRGAVVEIINEASAVLASTTTDGNGMYSVSVPANTMIQVRVKAQMLQGGAGPGWDVSVRDNTATDPPNPPPNPVYAMVSPTFSSGAVASATRDLNAPSGWGGAGYTSPRTAGSFAVLDTIYQAQAKVLSVAPATVFPPLRVFWSVNNTPSNGDPTIGQIGTTFFTNTRPGRAIYVLGKENVDTDEYDTSVVAHEWGHYYQSSFSRDDSPGGSHSLGDLVDRRLAFSEGWGNAWSGIALARSNYTDSVDQSQAQGSNIDLSAGVSSNPGWYREGSIQSILWNLNRQVGFKPIHDTLTGPFRSGLAVTSIHPFAAAFGVAAPSSASVLASLLVGQSISAAANDPFGSLEMNNGTVPRALPMYQTATVGGAINQACVTNQAGPGNKLGNFVYLRFTVPTAKSYTITVTGPAGSDPDFSLYSGGQQVAQAEGFGISETDSGDLPVGESLLVINDFNNTLGALSTCMTATIQ